MPDAISRTTLENLSRLATKKGVQATLVLSRKDGAIVQSTGLAVISSEETVSPEQARNQAPDTDQQISSQTTAGGEVHYGGAEQVNRKSAEEIARRVFAVISSCHDLADGMDQGSDVQLVRLRSHRREVVIVPDSKYLLVVIHEPPKTN